ncbi:NADH:flavin oxidoreductase/NADH oxidase family protein [Metarhizium anisopliae]
MTNLFKPIKVGRARLSHRIAMSPMTRLRSDDGHVPLPMVTDYYSQRTAVPGSLAITEGTYISAKAGGYDSVPGIYSREQIAAWKKVTDAVHANKSYIFLQLWAQGRTAEVDVLKREGPFDLTSSSDIPMGEDAASPRPLTEEEIYSFIEDHAQAAKNAIEAGFDGVEIHGANGYLIDQFTQDTANKRTDQWGGSIENRARFALEVTKAVVAAVGADRTGIRLSPWSSFQGMRMDDPIPQFTYLAGKLKDFGLAYVHLIESRSGADAAAKATDSLDFFFNEYNKASPILVAGGYDSTLAKEAVDSKYHDYDTVVVFGRPYISTPDLPFRVKEGLAFNKYDRSTFYLARSDKGYIDYSFSDQFNQVRAKA